MNKLNYQIGFYDNNFIIDETGKQDFLIEKGS